MDKITQNLWITDIETLSTESTDRFDVVVSVCQDTVGENVGCQYEHVTLADDHESAEKWGGSCSYGTFREAVDVTLHHLRLGKTVLVHCHKGRNRSASVCTATLACARNCPYEIAFEVVKDARVIASPNEIMRKHGVRYVDENIVRMTEGI